MKEKLIGLDIGGQMIFFVLGGVQEFTEDADDEQRVEDMVNVFI